MTTEAAFPQLSVAFVGAGYMVNEHLRAFQNLSGLSLSGIYSRNADKAASLAQTYSIPQVCGSIAELYEKTRARMVVIAVSELSVREVCLEAFKYPWICLIEKPAGYDFADAEAVVHASRQQDRRSYVALNRRHYGSTRKVLDDLAQLKGQRFIQVCDQEDPEAARRYGVPELIAQNWMYANSIHLIDYFRILGRGEIIRVVPICNWDARDPKFVAAKIEYSSGDVGLYQAVWNGPGPWSVAVTTQEKRWEMRPLEQAVFQVHGSRNLEKIAADDRDLNFKPGLRVQAEELVKAARNQPHNLPTLEEALESMRLVRAIYTEGYHV